MFKWLKRPAVATEARLSIRESLRQFALISVYLEENPTTGGSLFEKMVSNIIPTLAPMLAEQEHRSCGHTNQCFASLFFSPAQVSNGSISLHTNGAHWRAIVDNPNIVLYGLRKLLWKWPDVVSETLKTLLHRRAASVCDNLRNSLLHHDSPEILPRVVFVNITWVLSETLMNKLDISSSMGTNTNNIENTKNIKGLHLVEDVEQQKAEAKAAQDDWENVRDHQWSIIKHTNDHYQLVQGYIRSIAGNHSNRNAHLPWNSSAKAQDIRLGSDRSNFKGGFCLSSWQNQPYNSSIDDKHGRRFASRHGFDGAEMIQFLAKLGHFARDSDFDAGSFKKMFGVYSRESSGRPIWPAISFRELDDESIDGCGERFVVEGIARQMLLHKSGN
jgi:hypothetical protein